MEMKKWMIVSDNEITSNAIKDQVADGVNITLANDIGNAQAIADKEKFDVIITHWMMPEHSDMDKMNDFVRAGKDYSNVKAAFEDKLHSAMDRFKNNLKQKKPDSNKLIKQFTDKQNEIVKMLTSTIADLEKEKAAFDQKMSQLSSQVDTLTQKLALEEKKANKAIDDAKKSEQQNQTYQQKLSDADAQIRKLSEQMASLDASMKKTTQKQQQEIADLNKTISTLTQEKDDAVKKGISLEEKNLQTTQQMESLKKDLQSQLDQSQSENQAITEELNEMKQKNQEFENSIRSLVKDNQTKEKTIQEINVQLDKHKSDVQTITNLRSETRTLQKQVKDAMSLVEVAEAEKKALEKKVAEFEDYWNQYVRT